MTRTPPHFATRSSGLVCGVPMLRTWTDDRAVFRWRAVDGSIHGTVEDMPAGAPSSMAELLDLLAARGDMHSYSTMLTRYQAGQLELPWEHQHGALEPASQIAHEDVPECHGWLMRAVPGAWICRVDGEVCYPSATPREQR